MPHRALISHRAYWHRTRNEDISMDISIDILAHMVMGPIGARTLLLGCAPPPKTPAMAASPSKVCEIGRLRGEFHFHF